jgi:hypothetical protein
VSQVSDPAVQRVFHALLEDMPDAEPAPEPAPEPARRGRRAETPES